MIWRDLLTLYKDKSLKKNKSLNTYYLNIFQYSLHLNIIRLLNGLIKDPNNFITI